MVGLGHDKANILLESPFPVHPSLSSEDISLPLTKIRLRMYNRIVSPEVRSLTSLLLSSAGISYIARGR